MGPGSALALLACPGRQCAFSQHLFSTLHRIIASAIFSAVISVGKLVLAQGTTGKIEASTTRRPCTPLTRPSVSTTVIGSSVLPMRHEHEACQTPIAAL